jgi:hypothetical protein
MAFHDGAISVLFRSILMLIVLLLLLSLILLNLVKDGQFGYFCMEVFSRFAPFGDCSFLLPLLAVVPCVRVQNKWLTAGQVGMAGTVSLHFRLVLIGFRWSYAIEE